MRSGQPPGGPHWKQPLLASNRCEAHRYSYNFTQSRLLAYWQVWLQSNRLEPDLPVGSNRSDQMPGISDICDDHNPSRAPDILRKGPRGGGGVD